MNTNQPKFAVFVKPWKQMSIAEVGRHVKQLGFEWIELPVRPGFACTPEKIEQDLPQAVKTLADLGVHVLNVTVALPLNDERLYAACREAGVTMNRVILAAGVSIIGKPKPTPAANSTARCRCVSGMISRLGCKITTAARCRSTRWVFITCSKSTTHATPARFGTRRHNGLQGEEPEVGLDIVEKHLCVVNLKNAYWRKTSGPEAEVAQWEVYWTSGRQGRASWAQVATKVKQMNYTGPICFSAEYTAEHEVDRLIVEDLAFAKTLFA